ncbi:MAG: 3-oxoacyl-[acyl-carrier-protein] synthase III C-terminal domain-containing protein [Myxococcota bacterium]
MKPVGFRSLSVSFPDTVRTNDYFREQNPELVATAEERTLAKVWANHGGEPSTFDRTFEPFRDDPFRGTQERRALQPGEKMLPVEIDAARKAVAAAGLEPGDIDTVLATSFLPDTIGIGAAVFIAKALGIKGAAWNIETACSSATAGFQLASSLVRAEQAKHVLVVISCSYSRVSDPNDTFGWFLGDGCAAFVVGAVDEGYGHIAAHTINTAETCGAFWYMLDLDPEGKPWIRVEAGGKAGRSLRDTAEPYLRQCVEGAAKAAGVGLGDIDFFAFNTPTAWYGEFCVQTLGIDRDKTINTYPLYANMGPVLWPVNLHHAASLGKPKKDDLVLLYSVGSVSSAGSIVMRWGDVGLGPLPQRVQDDMDACTKLVAV